MRALGQAVRSGLPGVLAGALLLGLTGLSGEREGVGRVVAGLGWYVLIWGVGLGGIVWIARRRTRVEASGLGKRAWAWSGRWHGLVAGITAGGALVGGVVYPLVGGLAGLDYRLREMIWNGMTDGGFLALIWAPGISLVACVMWAVRRHRAEKAAIPGKE